MSWLAESVFRTLLSHVLSSSKSISDIFSSLRDSRRSVPYSIRLLPFSNFLSSLPEKMLFNPGQSCFDLSRELIELFSVYYPFPQEHLKTAQLFVERFDH